MKQDFFEEKKSWSHMKDAILALYLKPYINKVATRREVKELGLPIIIGDFFAGRGRFEDGTPGSPLIICEAAQRARERGIAVIGIFTEADPANYRALKANLAEYEKKTLAKVHEGEFEDHVNKILDEIAGCPSLFYLDPFGVRGIEFATLVRLFERARKESTEVLINFRYPELIRLIGSFDIDESEAAKIRKVKESKVNRAKAVMGGTDWVDIAFSGRPPMEKEEKILQLYKERLRGYFRYVCSCPVKDKDINIAKYHLVFGSQHPDALILMNRIMMPQYQEFLDREYRHGYLFDTRPPEKQKDIAALRRLVLRLVEENDPIRRQALWVKVLETPGYFLMYRHADFLQVIKGTLQDKDLYSDSGRLTTNDHTLLSRRPFASFKPAMKKKS